MCAHDNGKLYVPFEPRIDLTLRLIWPKKGIENIFKRVQVGSRRLFTPLERDKEEDTTYIQPCCAEGRGQMDGLCR